MAINTFVEVHNIPTIYIRAASSMGASKYHIYKTVIIHAIMPSLVSGFRVAAALAFGVAIAAEFMGAQSGIGFLIMGARRTLHTNTILLSIIIIALESYIFDWIIGFVSGRHLKWSERSLEAIQSVRFKTIGE